MLRSGLPPSTGASMASAIRHVTVDCIDVELVGTF
jgi:hypothetical protein